MYRVRYPESRRIIGEARSRPHDDSPGTLTSAPQNVSPMAPLMFDSFIRFDQRAEDPSWPSGAILSHSPPRYRGYCETLFASVAHRNAVPGAGVSDHQSIHRHKRNPV